MTMPRTLAFAVRRFVKSTSRMRGESYFLDGRVSTVRSDSGRFIATVRGSRTYDTALTLDGDRLIVDCTCPYFEDSLEPCKHIWAAILAADQARVFHVPEGLSLDFDDAFELDTPAREADSAGTPPRAAPPSWRTFLARVAPADEAAAGRALLTGEIIYVMDLARSATGGGLVIELMSRDRKKSGEWTKPKPLTLTRNDIARLPDERDRRILDAISGAAHAYDYSGTAWGAYTVPIPSALLLNTTLQRDLVPRLCETGRLMTGRPAGSSASVATPALVPVEWDPQPAEFRLRVTGDSQAGYTIGGSILRNGAEHTFAEVMFVTSALVLWRPAEPGHGPRFAAFDAGGADRWMTGLLDVGSVTVPAADRDLLVETLATSDLARVDCPDDVHVDATAVQPRPCVRIARPKGTYPGYYASADRLDAAVTFEYGECEVDAWSTLPVVFDRERRAAWRRDRDAERDALARLLSLGVRRLQDWQSGGTRLDFAASMLPSIVGVLIREGWRVEAEGRIYRRPGTVALDVRSGIDWFELHGRVDYDGIAADLPALLAAAKRGDAFVRLGDGTFGVMPVEWLARNGRIAALGTAAEDHLRFESSQGALLDAWLAIQPEVSCDEAFSRARAALARFERVDAIDPPPTFHGLLRDYQRDALAWFEFLRRFGFGGCLADEMGLGKTVMVLAMMESRRLERERAGRPPHPSLIVVPRSLIFNWHSEATRFAPALRVLDYTGGTRRSSADRLLDHDIVLTTYGTLRRDIGHLKEIAFDYAILDESQAIKNVRTNSAKAARLLNARHRLALSGTPVENHLGELWSLFDFLNPGILGAASIFTAAGALGHTADDEMLGVLARGLRPFILRRTKDQVAEELPARTEQTLYCELDPPQRALYDELRAHYRAALLGAGHDGLGRQKLQVLEALLRLRQAACHPGLIDPSRAADPSAKLDVLLPRLQELADDGRKVLVFSQFTTLLGLLRTRLDAAGLAYEYLDGKTRDREATVRRFQADACPLFLISLKAGGLGLNLTAAEYVFLLDPWWNPAVEAQAIDRAHRIGQTRPVFAFRLIARDTVEEKVLELQATKRKLADAVVRADRSLIRDLRREDLELLLS